MKNKLKEQKQLNNFLKDFLIRRPRIQTSSDVIADFELVEATLRNCIKLHKEDKQDFQQIIDLIGEYTNSNFKHHEK